MFDFTVIMLEEFWNLS